jgi:hypothetical protein
MIGRVDHRANRTIAAPRKEYDHAFRKPQPSLAVLRALVVEEPVCGKLMPLVDRLASEVEEPAAGRPRPLAGRLALEVEEPASGRPRPLVGRLALVVEELVGQPSLG